MSKSKLLSLFVSAFYLIAFVCLASRTHALREVIQGIGALLICLLLSLGCIWFSDEIAVIFDRGRWPELNPDWGFFVRIMGWFLLLLPAIIFVFRKIT